MSRFIRSALVIAIVLGIVPAAHATPVATTKEERETMGRSFLEPMESTNFIQHGPDAADAEFALGFGLLEKLFPRYAQFTTIDEEMNDPNAVSVGPDGVPAWDKNDTGDGQPFQMAIVTDFNVPDKNKEYVLFTAAHAAEPCGREGSIRFLEDLVIWATEDPDHILSDGTGTTGKTHEVTVAEALKKTKIYFVDVTPDGWVAGDVTGQYSQSNGAGVNSNRVAYQDGWVFPNDPIIFKNGYSVLTQPEGAAVSTYLKSVRNNEIGGRPWAVAADMHGPLPVGAILLHDQGNTPAKLNRVLDLAERIRQGMNGVLAEYMTPQGVEVYDQVTYYAGEVRDAIIGVYERILGGFPEKAAYITLRWAEYATIWEHIDYTVSGSWGGWAGSEAGLGAASISFEIDCENFEGWNPVSMQVFADNIRAIDTTAVVQAATMDVPNDKRKLGGTVGFYESGKRVTDKNGNPSPPPPGFPGNPIVKSIKQTPYNVSNTDYFRDLRDIVRDDVIEVGPKDLGSALNKVSSFVVSDVNVQKSNALQSFVEKGGNLILTDSALTMLPNLTDIDADLISKGYSYVGYSDLDRNHALTEGLYDRARQMFDPIGLGYELLMERDQYWPCNPDGSCEESPTKNSAPIWMVDRAEWERVGGVTVGTADPNEDRKATTEGKDTTRTNIGILKVGKGRIVIFGGLLPTPTEEYTHWFGINAYTISIPGQQLLLNALTVK